MTRFVVGDDRSQSTLFPERLDDYLGEDNPVRAVDVFVDELDLAGLGFGGVEPEVTAEKRTFRFGWVPPHQLRNRQYEPSFTLVLVQSGSIPKAIEFVLNPPAS